MQPLGKNHGGYFGERIDIREILRDVAETARRNRWETDTLPVAPALELLALRRLVPAARRRVYISAGIHGDEPAGPLAVRQLLRENAWPPDADLWLCPCLNPVGFEGNTRGNGGGVDLNRDYRHQQSAEVQAHVRWLERQPPFDFGLCLHEDWEAHGFYLYEVNPGPREPLAPRIVAAVAKVCPIDISPEIEGRPASGGIIVPPFDPEARPLWPEAIYLCRHKTRQCCTLEAPSDFPLSTRVAALVTAVKAALEIAS